MSDQSSIEAAARALAATRAEGVVEVWPGFIIRNGTLSDEPCLVVSAVPERIDNARSAMPAQFRGFAVDVRPASVTQQLGEPLREKGVSAISYNDKDRTGDGFSFDWIHEEMAVLAHVGPERSWVVLREFLGDASSRLVSSMYEFHAAHIASAVEQRLDEGVDLRLVLAVQSRDPSNGEIPDGDFDRSDTFERWEGTFEDRFDRIFVPLGSDGLVAMSYHIKVTVRDEGDAAVTWLSSGNWKRRSQPLIPEEGLNDPRVAGRAGNREWHVVVRNTTLSNRFRNHIEADFAHSRTLGGTVDAIEPQLFVDVPIALLKAVAPVPSRLLEPLQLKGKIRVKPLLTPDQGGAIFSNAVLELIRSAREQLLFQNQYIKMRGADTGFLKELVDALIDRANAIDDVRIILRSENDDLEFDVSQLKRRGLDVDRCVRVLSGTHTKGIIVDRREVLVGSHNWSALGVSLNRDASLIFANEELAAYYAEAFEIDWNRARTPSFDQFAPAEAPRVNRGDTPVPPGFARITLSDYLEG